MDPDDDVDFWGADAMNNYTGPYNCGFLALRPTEVMTDVISHWRKFLEKQTKAKSNQRTFNNIVRRRDTADLKHKLLPQAQFPVGKILEGTEITPSSLGSEVVVFHNNWCEGNCSKPQRARELGLWHPTSYKEFFP